ncbi:MAG: hypothetical protein HKM93_02890, partial [Desulfobacteraceae bacterium]|nr:hypothetical protein [Desulfobacteraceae bacterium]
TLTDLMTVREVAGNISGRTIVIGGDIFSNYSARSNCIGFTKLGAQVLIAGPMSLIPPGFEDIGATICPVDEAIRQGDVFLWHSATDETGPPIKGVSQPNIHPLFQLSDASIPHMKKEAVVIHNGVCSERKKLAYQRNGIKILDMLSQAGNGVAIRMALLYLIAGGNRGPTAY